MTAIVMTMILTRLTAGFLSLKGRVPENSSRRPHFIGG